VKGDTATRAISMPLSLQPVVEKLANTVQRVIAGVCSTLQPFTYFDAFSPLALNTLITNVIVCLSSALD